MYNIRSLITGEFYLYKDDLKLVILPEWSHISIEFVIDQKHFQKRYDILEYFLDEIKNTEDFSTLEITLNTVDTTYPITYNTSSSLVTGEFVSLLEAPYTKEMYIHKQGLSDYSYVYEYMPYWSTAFKNLYSNHTKTFEPLFTNALNIDYNISNLIEDKPIQSLKNILFYRKDEISKNVSEKEINSFIKEKEYVFNSEDVIDFGTTYTTIYFKLKNPGSYKLRVKGVYNSAYIKEDILISGSAVFKLNLKYTQIYSINMIDFYDQSDLNSVLISNAYNMESFNYYNKEGRSLEYLNDKVILTNINKDSKNVFINKLPYSSGMFIDENDNIVAEFNSKLYTAKLNSKLTLDIPEDITYNNTTYIETVYLSPNEYEVGVEVRQFAVDFEDSRVCISLSDSKQKTFYLNSNFELEESLVDIYVDSNTLKEKIHFTVELDSDVEYVIISIKDNTGIYKKSNLIVQPFIEFVPNLYILPTEELLILNDKLFLLNTSEFKLTPLILNPTQISLKDSINYSYYYITSETYPLATLPDLVEQSISDFNIEITTTRFEKDLATESISGGTGSFIEAIDLKSMIKYSTYSTNEDYTYATGLSDFEVLNTSVIKYSTYTLEKESFSNKGAYGFSTKIETYPIINEDLYNKISVAISEFEIILED